MCWNCTTKRVRLYAENGYQEQTEKYAGRICEKKLGDNMCINMRKNWNCICSSTGTPGRLHDGYEDFGPCPYCGGSGCSNECDDCDEREEE